MTKIFLFIVFATVAQFASAQADTSYLYINKDWKNCPKESAFFYGKVYKDRDKWHRKDFWAKTNLMQMDGYFSDSATEIKDGPVRYYHENGLLDDSSNYEKNFRRSAYYFYDNHTLKAYVIFDKDENTAEQKAWDGNGNEVPGYIVQRTAMFPGGAEKWQEYLVASLGEKLPKRYTKGEIWGTVQVDFEIMEDGSVKNVKISKSSGYKELDKHAMAIIANSIQWMPAVEFNKTVVFFQRQAITYPKPE